MFEFNHKIIECIECAIPHKCCWYGKCAQCKSKYSFIACEPTLLECHHHICKECKEKAKKSELNCKFCNEGIKSLDIVNKASVLTIETHLDTLTTRLKNTFDSTINVYDECKILIESEVNIKRQNAKNDVDKKIDEIKNAFDKIREDFYKDIDTQCDSFLATVLSSTSDSFKEKAQELKTFDQHKPKNMKSFYEYQKVLKQMLESIQSSYDLDFKIKFKELDFPISKNSIGEVLSEIQKEKELQTSHAIGIDLGTAFTKASIFQDGKVEMIPNDQANFTTASYVAFDESKTLIGDDAKSRSFLNPTNTIFDFKRLIGRKFDDPSLQNFKKTFPFEIFNFNGKPKILIELNGVQKNYFAEEIMSLFLQKIKINAERYLRKRIDNVVVAIPSGFNCFQREVVKIAGKKAGLYVWFTNEAACTSVAYGMKEIIHGEKIVLVFDFGAGYLNVSVISIEEGIFEVKATAGASNIGGEDIDNRLVNNFAEEFKKKFRKDLMQNKKALMRLRTACEKAKCHLSSYETAKIEIDSLLDDIDFYTSITRAKFEDINIDLFRSSLDIVEKALKDAKIDKSGIHEILLTGGSSRIPKIQSLLQQFFNGKILNKCMNLDEAVAFGAAIKGAIWSGLRHPKIEDNLVLEVYPSTIGVATAGGVMTAIIKRNSIIPTKQSIILCTNSDNQTSIILRIYEGERAMVKDNVYIDEIEIKDIVAAPKGVSQIEVTFDIDNLFCLVVSVKNKTNAENKITKNIVFELRDCPTLEIPNNKSATLPKI